MQRWRWRRGQEPTGSVRTIAVDWSGAKHGAESAIWLAEVRGGIVERLEGGRSREAVSELLLAERARDPALVVGLDFAFSFPRWFLADHGLRSAFELWELAAAHGEEWLQRCEPPFWGRPGKRRPAVREHFRRADLEVPPVAGIRPKSVFQVGGAGAVGTGSIRGMPILRRLREGGFTIWPFDARGPSVVLEIYPRILTGAVAKSSAEGRRAYLLARHPGLSAPVMQAATGSEDAFDALVSALAMDRHRAALTRLDGARDEQDRLEGRIWVPSREVSPGR